MGDWTGSSSPARRLAGSALAAASLPATLPPLIHFIFSRVAFERRKSLLRVSDVFRLWDADKNGLLSAHELRRGASRLGISAHEAEWAQLARITLSFADFRELIAEHASERNSHAATGGGARGKGRGARGTSSAGGFRSEGQSWEGPGDDDGSMSFMTLVSPRFQDMPDHAASQPGPNRLQRCPVNLFAKEEQRDLPPYDFEPVGPAHGRKGGAVEHTWAEDEARFAGAATGAATKSGGESPPLSADEVHKQLHKRLACDTADARGGCLGSLGLVYLGLGANLGDRVSQIRGALRGLGELGRVVATSSLVESPPWTPPGWSGDPQPHYVNGVCTLETALEPPLLLHAIKELEERLGRSPGGVRYAARTIDIDVLAFADGTALEHDGGGDESRRLSVPHKRMHERAFVLQPLSELAPGLAHPQLGCTVAELLAGLLARGGGGPLPRVAGIGRVDDACARSEPVVWRWGAKSYVMGVLNVAPDSAAVQMVLDGADMLDIGGVSTRPGAAAVGEAEELARVLPLIEALRADGLGIPISVDTSCAAVARAAVRAGADAVNDVSGGAADARMLATLAELGVPAVLMHTRGTPQSMQGMAAYAAEAGGVVSAVGVELGARLDAARAAGVPSFDLVADPGIGFAKDAAHNLQLLQALGQLGRLWRAPLLLGASRKRFIGALVGEAEPKRRDWGTAAVSACCVPEADVHRVHDVKAMAQVLCVADAIRRQRW
ncbi:Dihydropteroate synthase-like protein [Pavlovales sp. CCMP2436]|nr:Dihydropteroate synthase-like protein [Pavlovales sp. CCMP2436]